MADTPRLLLPGTSTGDHLDRDLYLKRKAEDRRRVQDAAAAKAAELRRQAEAVGDRTFAEQIEALRKVCNRQIAVLELQERAGGMLSPQHFKSLQSLAFVVRSLAQEARAQAAGWDPSSLSQAELEGVAGGQEGPIGGDAS